MGRNGLLVTGGIKSTKISAEKVLICLVGQLHKQAARAVVEIIKNISVISCTICSSLHSSFHPIDFSVGLVFMVVD